VLIVAVAGAFVPEVPIAARRKRSTGIVGLNLLLDGGFPEGTIIMVHGTALAGIDIAAAQFWQGDSDETGTYLVAEDIINEETDSTASMEPDRFLERMAGERIVIDSLSTILDRYGIEETLGLLRLAREEMAGRQANAMFIVFTGIHTPMEMTRLMKASDVVIEFQTTIQQSEIARTLCVHKIKDGAAPRRLLPFIITENGIEASTTSRVV
jgi:KaiC/GvpD/RAD55 family RecA-like ATPase